MSALRQRQEQGGFWNVEVALAKTMMEVLFLPLEKEAAVPVSNDDMLKYLIDQKSNLNDATFTRLAPGARLSVTPSFAATGPAILGAHDPFTTTWDQPPFAKVPVPHQPSAYAKRGLVGEYTGYGHEDIMLRKSEAACRDVANRRLVEREALYSDFLKEATRVYVSSVTHNLEDLGDLVSLYTSVSRIRLRSTEPVLRAAEDVVKLIVRHFGQPNVAIEKIQGDLRYADEGGLVFGKVDPLNAFSLACRKELEDIFQSAF